MARVRKIPLSQGKYALVDEEDFEFLSNWNWCASLESRGTKWYAIRWQTIDGKQRKIRMHRVIMECPAGMVVDHLNHDSLDNRRCNLEIVTQEENMARSKGWCRKKEEPAL